MKTKEDKVKYDCKIQGHIFRTLTSEGLVVQCDKCRKVFRYDVTNSLVPSIRYFKLIEIEIIEKEIKKDG